MRTDAASHAWENVRAPSRTPRPGPRRRDPRGSIPSYGPAQRGPNSLRSPSSSSLSGSPSAPELPAADPQMQSIRPFLRFLAPCLMQTQMASMGCARSRSARDPVSNALGMGEPLRHLRQSDGGRPSSSLRPSPPLGRRVSQSFPPCYMRGATIKDGFASHWVDCKGGVSAFSVGKQLTPLHPLAWRFVPRLGPAGPPSHHDGTQHDGRDNHQDA